MTRFRNFVYLTAWNNHVLDVSLLARVAHVSLAFTSSDVFVQDKPEKWPLFESVETIRGKFAPGTKVLVAIGGWGDNHGFSQAAKSDASRRQFARKVAAMIRDTGADGVDIDWEYPGGNGNNYKEVPNSERVWEIEAFPKLLAEIRHELGPDSVLCAAVPGLPRDVLAFTKDTVPEISRSLDIVNVMTYDLMNRRDAITKHHAGIQGSLESIDTYIAYGFPPDKLNLGFAFYVKWFNAVPAEQPSDPFGCKPVLMEDPETGADLGQTGALTWSNVPAEMADGLKRALKDGSYDEIGGGHHYWDSADKRWWTWETPEAVKKKFVSIVPTKQLGGIFAWALGEDSSESKHLKALDEVVAEHVR